MALAVISLVEVGVVGGALFALVRVVVTVEAVLLTTAFVTELIEVETIRLVLRYTPSLTPVIVMVPVVDPAEIVIVLDERV